MSIITITFFGDGISLSILALGDILGDLLSDVGVSCLLRDLLSSLDLLFIVTNIILI